MENICGVDIFIVAVLLLSAILSFSRGLMEEMLGIGAWLLAGIAGFYAMPLLEPYSLRYLSKPILANLASFTVVGLLTLVILTLVSSKISEKVHKSALNRLDHFLGFIFGAVRGVVILVLVYFLMMTLAPKTLEKYQKESRTFPYLERVTDNVKGHLPESLFDNPSKKDDDKPDDLEKLIKKLNKPAKPAKKAAKPEKAPAPEAVEKPVDPERTLFEELNDPTEKKNDSAPKKEKQGYDKREREQLDKLFLESVDDG